MFSRFWQLAGLAAAAAAALSVDESDFAPEDIITRDVCILGGGATGTYAAIQLKDQDHSVVLVERNGQLGGHSETLYIGDNYINYGVEGVFNDDTSRKFFNRLGVQSKPLLLDTLIDEYANFKTGEKVGSPSDILGTVAAALLYRAAIEPYTTLQQGVYYLPDPVPEELLEPFSTFVEKHALQGALRLVFMFAQNVGNILDAPTIYIIQNFGVPHVNALLEGYMTPTNGMVELYQSAAGVLGHDVLLQTTAVETDRSDSGVSLVVENHADGTKKLIRAKKLLVTFPPLVQSLKGFDLDTTETGLFEKWHWMTYYVAVVNNTGAPEKVTVANSDPANRPGSLPHTPFEWQFEYMGVPGYLTSKIIADSDFTAKDAKDLILSDIQRLRDAGTFSNDTAEDPSIVAFGSHSPETMIVSTDDIRNGFYRNLYNLQGRRSTFYSGLTFCTDYSSLLWAYTDTVIDSMFGTSS
ncbi:hypothetical protein PISL3812_07949 [Talaromyces islandicus]|uniref:Amine oxidase domain-containing protein n=1 Tax=Talaromyces islandicus TaxID=28573 RepID=A0A0U1M5N4_TALIS|nr:hypothetical protein PISL3812_07949 [Talaromyces islandicus]